MMTGPKKIITKMNTQKNINLLPLLFFLFVIYGCNQPIEKEINKTIQLKPDLTIKYSERFLISEGENFRVVHLLGKANSKDTTANFIIYDSLKPSLQLPNSYFVKSKDSRIISLSSIYTTMLSELHCSENIVAIENADYYSNPTILKRVEEGKILQVQKNPEIDREAVIKLAPDIIFAFGMGQTSNDFDVKLMESGIPVLISLDHLEKLPLARAEWIKVFAAFVNKSSLADSLFNQIEMSYLNLKTKALEYKTKPTVLTELKYGDTWYVPGGKSFMGQLISDANATYLWSNDTASGSLPLSFEEVYQKARNADYWLNVSMCTDKKQVVAQDHRYADFLAFKTNSIYNNNLHRNALNYSTYWETGILYPNKILSDFISIFHQQKGDTIASKLNYYTQMK